MNIFVGTWIFVTAVAQIGASSEVNVTVFYESLCPDSIRFIRKQLYPTYKALRHYMTVEYVPFGKAYITTNPWSITCQHGSRECRGNAMQACALNMYPDPDIQAEIVHCHMSDSDPSTASHRCAKKINYDDTGIDECAYGKEGRALLKNHEERTRSFTERLRFVPTILFNDVYSVRDQNDALVKLKSVVCRKLEPEVPEECKGPGARGGLCRTVRPPRRIPNCCRRSKLILPFCWKKSALVSLEVFF